MLRVKIPFGFNTFSFDSQLTIFTGKIRVKSNPETFDALLRQFPSLRLTTSGESNQFTTISFATTCSITNSDLIKEINALLCSIMHKRIDAKYAPMIWEPELMEDWLPF